MQESTESSEATDKQRCNHQSHPGRSEFRAPLHSTHEDLSAAAPALERVDKIIPLRARTVHVREERWRHKDHRTGDWRE
jgi:hypothetical protein